MWFGTEGGLAKFDGRRTHVLKDTSLGGTRILALRTDEDGVLWIGTDGGASRLVNGQLQSIAEVRGQSISAIHLPERGKALLASEQGNVFECSGGAGSLSVRPLLATALQSADRERPGPLALTSVTVHDGNVLVGSMSRGLIAIANGVASEVPDRRSGFFVRALTTDHEGRLWMGTRVRREEQGVFFGAPGQLQRSDAQTGPVAVMQTIGDAVFVGTDGRGVYRYGVEEVERFTFDGTAGGLRSDRVYAIFADREGVIWFGTDRGVSRFDPQAPRVEPVGTIADSNFVRSVVHLSNGTLLAGTNRGLFVYDEEDTSWESITAHARNIIYSLHENRDGYLFVGSASGFFVSQRPATGGALDALQFNRVAVGSGNADAPGSVRAIAEFRDRTYFASFGRGVEHYADGRVNSAWPKDANLDVISLFADGEQRLLVGAADGLLVFDGEKIIESPQFETFKGAAVRAIARTGDNTLWLGTSRGLYWCRAEETCVLAVAGDIRGIATSRIPNQTAVWAGTAGSGLLKVALDADVGPVVSQIDVEQGLPSQNVFSVALEENDRSVLIGTNRGMVRYGPGQTKPALYANRIVSKRLHQPAELRSGLDLEYPQNSLLLDVAAISSRTFPEQFQYAFVVTDSNGVTIKQRLSRESEFAIEGLRSGRYRVTARAFTRDLVTSYPIAFDLNIARAPFPWTSTALAILLALTLLALLWALLERSRIVRTSAALVQANNELADARLDLANEAERERRRIARDLHDQTLADLRHLMLLTDQLPANGEEVKVSGGLRKSGNAALLRGEIESISQEVRRICEDLSPSVLQNVGFAAALEFALSHAIQAALPKQKFAYDFICDERLEEKNPLPANVQMQIYRITQEVVNNICRHASPSYVRMEVNSTDEGTFSLILEDDGVGFDPGEAARADGRGLANIRARARLIDADVSWRARDGGGTVFKLERKFASAE